MIVDQSKQNLALARQKLMTKKRVICTGNPNRPGTLASGIQKIYPEAMFLCRSNGWDLSDTSDDNRQKISKAMTGHNIFFNCSYIDTMVQSFLLDICHDTIRFCNVINVGSTHEYDGGGTECYRSSKLDLRTRSMQYNSFRFMTCHFILGGIKKDDAIEKKDWLDIDLICEAMVKVWDMPYHTPLIAIDAFKEPW